MSEAQHPAPEEGHAGPIKTPKQLLFTVLFAFIVPILIIAALVVYVTSGFKPSGAEKGQGASLSGMSQDARARGMAARLERVGVVEIRDANRVLASGEEVFKGQCAACHATGVAGAPKHSDAAAWAPRLTKGYDTLHEHAIKGFNAMPPQGGGNFGDLEIGRAVVYMANDAGGKFPEPAAPAAPADGAAAPAK